MIPDGGCGVMVVWGWGGGGGGGGGRQPANTSFSSKPTSSNLLGAALSSKVVYIAKDMDPDQTAPLV